MEKCNDIGDLHELEKDDNGASTTYTDVEVICS